MSKFLIIFVCFIPSLTFADHRKGPSSEKVSKEAAAYITDKKRDKIYHLSEWLNSKI